MGFLALVPKKLLCAIGFAAMAIVGRRRRGISLGPCVLLLLAALVAVLLTPHQTTALLGGIALAWADKSSGSRK
ncbi:hypothetical protein [Nonomuraea jabiensis]|uniref:Uncharacterized protein n=1 Tax=Nonomuraea jabiensis TaxID=882448 RepID=A0A7W9GE12_9ACTN|nr:hypothetical protein [Nonomuraea jabiensis]MBB5782090.1 hypothetical protein [Nonomuraea jabiensis]